MDRTATQTTSNSSLSSQTLPEAAGVEKDVEKTATHERQQSRDSRPLQKAVTAQDWTGPDDPENPMNWPLLKKIYHTSIPGLLCFTMQVMSASKLP